MASNSWEEESNGSNPSIESPSQAQPTVWLERLPREIYFNILSRQSIFSLLECKLVSRNWHSSIKDPLLANMHLTHSDENNLCLLFFSDWPKSKLQLVQLEHPEPETRTIKILKTPFESVLPEFEVRVTKIIWCFFPFKHLQSSLWIRVPSEDKGIQGPSCGGLDRDNYHLLTLRGCLSATVSCRDGSNEIWVMNVYNVKASWMKEFVIGNYVPQGLRLDMAPPARRRKNGCQGRAFRVLCGLKNGEILCLYRSSCVVSYNPVSGEFKELNFQGLPLELQAIVHVGSLISVNTMFGM